MATIKEALSSVNSMTVSNLNNLASSQTAGWQSDVVDNSTDLYVDAIVQVIVDMANTAPANDKALYVYAYGGLETTYTNPASGTQGCITIVNPSVLKLIGVIPYGTADEVIESQPMSVAAAFGGVMPQKWGIMIINYTGAAIASSGNSVKWTGVTYTSA